MDYTHSNSDIFTNSTYNNDTVAFNFVEEVMATINKKRICNKHGIYNSIESAQCPLCKKINNDTYDKTIRKSDRVKIYNSKKWKQVRELALLRDHLMCIPCAKNGNDVLATEVHHIIELAEDITKAYDLENLESICHSCHMQNHH